MYADQDRGDQEKYQRYLAGMDTIIVEKVASASAYFHEKEGHSIVDVGMASGTSSYILALLFPNTKIIGVDINPKMVGIAAETYSLPNLEFRVDDGETLQSLSNEKISGFFNCSSIHHITSFNNYAQNKAYLTLQRQAELLCEDGVIVIRDFVKPEDKNVIIQFPENKQGQHDAKLLGQFARTARSLAPADEQGFPIEKIDYNGREAYQLNYPDAIEFVRRKDYLNDWDVELQEEYAYYSQDDFESVLTSLGLRTIVSQPIYNSWIINNRYTGKFKIYELDGSLMSCPPTNYVIAAEKVPHKGTLLKSARQLPMNDASFLKVESFINTSSGEIFDVAQRPGSVIDVLPYTRSGKKVRILAKHAYPRPILHQNNRLIDNKRYSGYIIEGITAGVRNKTSNEALKQLLKDQLDILDDNIGGISNELSFYTSPGGINEKVESYHIDIKDFIAFPKEIGSYSGFNHSGSYRSYDALQLLKSAQVGALPDARLELSIYRLMQQLNLSSGKWLNEFCTIKEVHELSVTDIKNIQDEVETPFEPTNKSANFLFHHRSKFYEYPIDTSEQVLEYIEPQKLSSNTIVTLPVYSCNGLVYVGIEKRNLPVPQLIDGNSCLLTVPAFRLPKEVSNQKEMKEFVLKRDFFNAKVDTITKLGEKYLPCIGISPEQVYPHIVTLNKPSKDLYWITLDQLIENAHKLKDGHLLIAIYRLKHQLE